MAALLRRVAWEPSAGALANFLLTATQAFIVDLYEITLSGGSVLRYNNSDIAVTVNSLSYPLGPTFSRTKTSIGVGISVDTLEVTISAGASVLVNSVPLIAFIASGGFDGARLKLSRAFADAPSRSPNWKGVVDLFEGRLSEIETTRYDARITVSSDAELLNVMVPRSIYQPGCGNTLFDKTCGLAKASYATTVTATSTTGTDRVTFGSNYAGAAGYLSLGWIVGLTGANAGIGRTIKRSQSFAGSISVVYRWPQPVAIGDTFTAYPGCDKQKATCSSKFANLARFRGHPYVPAPETVM